MNNEPKNPRIIVYHCNSCSSGILKMTISKQDNGNVTMDLKNCDECGQTVPVTTAPRVLSKVEQ